MSASDRFDWFNDVVARALVPTLLSAKDTTAFHAEGSALDLGSVRVSRYSYSPVRSRRTAAQIRQGDPEQYQLGLVTKGSMWLSQNDGHSGLLRGDMVLWDTSRPFEAGSSWSDPMIEAFILHIPKSEMSLRANHVDRLLARTIPAGSGMAAILARFLVTLTDYGRDCRPQEMSGLGTTALDLATACLAQRLGAQQLPTEANPQALRYRINTFVQVNLGDTELTPQAIADHHHISLRTLYNMFEDQQESVAGSIRRRRLEQCRADLSDPRLREQPVQSIAARWGFASATAFSRAFRAAFGTTPTEFRQQALNADPATGETARLTTLAVRPEQTSAWPEG